MLILLREDRDEKSAEWKAFTDSEVFTVKREPKKPKRARKK